MVAPAGPVNPGRFRRGIALLGAHYQVRVPTDIARSDGYLAGTDDERAAEIDRMLRDPDVRAIIVARGGYGVLRLLPRLDPEPLRRDPKPIVGFSDATALLAWAEHAGVRGVHGPVASQLGDLPPEDLAALVGVLGGATPGVLPAPLTPIGAPRPSPGPLEGVLRGGNLTLLTHLIGTPWQVTSAGTLMLLEEVGEKPYAIDRYLTHLHLAGALGGVAGAVVGDLTRCTDPPRPARAPDDPAPAMAVVDERLRAAGIAGGRGAPVGHGRRNRALPWGARTVLHDDGRLEVLEPATR
ncbi:MAG: LD-carboxypeptidase [Kofleriaceae bacterium]|nr:LD-carboxypeptidase [Myxococcales bacterium]MCB9570615.1 LD-carboxypeptidase [Kofleriaceae bacterium]